MKESSERRRQRSEAPALNEGADAAEWVRERLELAVDSLQERVLRTTNKRGILNCSRQWGKSTITAAKAVHQAYHTAETTRSRWNCRTGRGLWGCPGRKRRFAGSRRSRCCWWMKRRGAATSCTWRSGRCRSEERRVWMECR